MYTHNIKPQHRDGKEILINTHTLVFRAKCLYVYLSKAFVKLETFV